MEKIVLIDGNNILFRSYYATIYSGNILKNSKGFPTNALLGLINTVNKIIEDEKPSYIMIAFDKGKTFRHDKYLEYKEGRIETPDDLKKQFPVAKELVKAMGITYYEVDNYEADDIIGTFASKVDREKDYKAVIISSDKDLLQLISNDVEVKLLKQTDHIRMTKEEFLNTYNMEPIRMIDLKALMGDSSDNIPGVKGVGEKTALSLLQEHKTLDGVYENIENIKGKLKEKLELGKDSAYMSYDLATIYKEVPVDTTFENIRYSGYDPFKYIEMLEELEFYSTIKKLNIKKDTIRTNVLKEELKTEIITDLTKLDKKKEYSFYLELLGYNYHDATPLGLSLYDGKQAYYVPIDVLKKGKLDASILKYTYDLKKAIYVLNKLGITLNDCSYDQMIAAYLLNYTLKDDISYLMKNDGSEVLFYEEEFGTLAKLKVPDEDILIKNASLRAKYIFDTKDTYIERLKEENAWYLFEEIEMPLVYVLADMEITGINVNEGILNDMGEEIANKLQDLTHEIYTYAEMEFNIASPKQLGDVLFNKLKIPYPKKIKDANYSTGKEILDKISGFHPIVPLIENYRTLAKLHSNYIVGLLSEIESDGKIHTIFNQTLTRTGRLSSSNPNLQNIPIRLEYGRLIRKAFVPSKDSILLSSDYSQIELRLFAHISGADNLIEAFIDKKDIHTKTASDIFKVSEEEVTSELRRRAKAVNFGILYGISSFGLSEDLNIDFSEAKRFIDEYLNTYPRIKEYMNEIVSNAHRDGFVKTIMNRKRVIDELKNKNYMIRSSGERMALNTPIQGSSADILKKAMVDIYREFTKRNLKSKMLLQVHDELVFDVLKEEVEVVEKIIKETMETTYELSVPLVVDINKGSNWYEAK